MGNSASNDDNSSDFNSKSTSDQVAENYGSFAEGKFAVVTGVERVHTRHSNNTIL